MLSGSLGRQLRRCHWLYFLVVAMALVGSAAVRAAEPIFTVKSASALAPTMADDAALQQALKYLRRRQASDGGWHSDTYAIMRSGQALTPFVLHVLLDAGAESRTARARLALEFIRQRVNADGAIGLADPDILEYPVYSTGYAVRCLAKCDDPQDAALLARMAEWLTGQQFRESGGFSPNEAVFGGWGFGGPRSISKPGHMDLAHTRRALEALNCIGRLDGSARRDALVFLARMQRWPGNNIDDGSPISPTAVPLAPFDGGFYFSPTVLAANKAQQPGDDESISRSYATATCDGLLALLAAGVAEDDPRVQAARQWLLDHPRWDYPEGIPKEGNPWGDAVFFYHLAVRAEASAKLDLPGQWRDEAQRILLGEQRPDGSFCNLRSSLMKEDDPLVATALAVIALTHLQPLGRCR